MPLSLPVTSCVTRLLGEKSKQINDVTSVTSVTSPARTHMRARVMCS